MKILDLGLIKYEVSLQIMENLIEEVKKENKNILLFCTHFPVYTVGSDSIQTNLKAIKTDRGGSITYHDEGTLMVYFIFKVHSPPLFYKKVIKAFNKFFKNINKNIYYDYKKPGFYIENRKIASLGFKYTRGISKHGVSLHISPNLKNFNKIKPCNLEGVIATSFEKENINLTLNEIKKRLKKYIKNEFEKAESKSTLS